MPQFVIFAFLALLFFVISSILLKLTAKHKIENSLVFYFYYLFIYFLLGSLIPIFEPIDFSPTDFPALKPVILCSIIGFLSCLFFFYSLYELDLTTFVPLYNFQKIFTALLAPLLLGETVSLEKVPWLLIIFGAGFFVTIDERMNLRSFFQKPVLSFLVYVFGISLLNILINQGVASVGYWNFLFYTKVYSFILPALFLLPNVYKNLKISLSQLWPVWASTTLEFIAILFLTKALAQNVIISTIIVGLPLGPIITYIISRSRPELLEHHTSKVYIIRFLAIFLMFFATIMLIFK